MTIPDPQPSRPVGRWHTKQRLRRVTAGVECPEADDPDRVAGVFG